MRNIANMHSNHRALVKMNITFFGLIFFKTLFSLKGLVSKHLVLYWITVVYTSLKMVQIRSVFETEHG